MAKPRNPKRDEAFELFKKHRGDITNREIAEQLEINEKTLSRWKSQDKWHEQLGIQKVRSEKRSSHIKTSHSNDFRTKKKEQIEKALVEAGSYSPALDLLIDVYLDAYEEYESLKSEGIADEKSRRELSRLLGQLGLDGE
ncbi:phage terminase small subunit-related protein [Metasolibacillus meyeri]|uniref:phage terminase small subunit-related protein n=1 Tax=Metasolibacillus meyeri TaxID=1071052 RepID=UPI000D315CAD|nr:phage terminase small subunit-related protein [Metasolibacillus meyeri]